MSRFDHRVPQSAPKKLITRVQQARTPLRTLADLDPLLERVGEARYVLLGEASHGTSEFYTWRALISKRLILEKGFNIIGVEGDWPDCARANRYVSGAPGAPADARSALSAFDRWPAWMWANWEVAAFLDWLARHNATLPPAERVTFHGLDVYSLWDSLHAVMGYLSRDGPALAAAQAALNCFEPYEQDIHRYARATALVPRSCELEVCEMLTELRRSGPRRLEEDSDAFFDAEQNALIVRNAEHYYRTMIRADNESWNIRDRHMVETLERLMRHRGAGAKAIVWAHNTHIGDARATDMAALGMLNIGQLVRELNPPGRVVIVGFGAHRGTVIAGKHWEAPLERMNVPPAAANSWEDVFQRAGGGDQWLLLGEHSPPPMHPPRGHRAIGVAYDPSREHGNYVPTVLPQRYDAFLFFEEARALHPLGLAPTDRGEPPETYPWGM